MPESPSDRRLAENEVVFRKLNEQFVKGVEENDKIAAEDNQPEFMIKADSGDRPLQFFCECSDEKCTKRIKISLREYDGLHTSKNHFVVVPGHEVLTIESVIKSHEPEYAIVEKLTAPPPDSDKLNPTDIKNF